jgi:hypothetical protein
VSGEAVDVAVEELTEERFVEGGAHEDPIDEQIASRRWSQ